MISELYKASRAIIDRLISLKDPRKADVEGVKFEICRELSISGLPSNSQIIAALKPEEKKKLLPILRRKEIRAASGVNIIAVMTKPRACPHGRCIYCPGGPEEDVPQSYTGHEPAAMRGSQNNYDPYMQVTSRIEQLKAIGHEVDKVDLIIMGGTFPAAPADYQKEFVKGCLDAMTGKHSQSFIESKRNAEESTVVRNVGITVETRPDCINEHDIKAMLSLGVTRVELGVQNVYDDIYELVKRGHDVKDVIKGTQLMKDSGLKICYHMMPGLPGSSYERDLEGFKTIFEDQRFKPDMIKIYPTLVIEGTELYKWWKRGQYKPLSTNSAIELISEIKKSIPPWIRIMRVQRDIPRPFITAGVNKGNLRELIQEHLKSEGTKCNCIRCREVGHKETSNFNPDNLEIITRNYEASEGLEYFISIEDLNSDVLIGFIRLRIPSKNVFMTEINNAQTALIRELHVYGQMVPVGEKNPEGWQHKGWGIELLKTAEKISYEKHGIEKLVVMSALGTKSYYEKLGYHKDGVYMSKYFNNETFNVGL